MNLFSKHRIKIGLPILAFIFLAIGILLENGLLNNSNEQLNQRDGKHLKVFLEEKISFISNSINEEELKDSLTLSQSYKDNLSRNNVLYSLIDNSSEKKWQNNSFDFDKSSKDSTVSLKLVENGWYIMGFKTRGTQRLILYYQFFFKNYRQNETIHFAFNEDVPLKREIEFQPKAHEEGSFYLSKIEDTEVRGRFMDSPKRPRSLWYYGLFILLSFFYMVLINYEKNSFNNWRFVKIYVLFMVILRVLYYRSIILIELRNTAFFSPDVYASNIFSSSIGDITLDILIWLPVVFYLNHEHNPVVSFIRKLFNKRHLISEIILNILIVLLCLMLTSFVKQLILDSVISFSLFQAGSINFYTFVGIFLLFILILIVCFLSFAFSRMFGREETKNNKVIILVSFIVILTTLSFVQDSLSIWLAMTSYCFLYLVIRVFDIRKRTFTPFLFVLYFNLMVTIVISFYTDFKEKESRKNFAIKALFGYDLETEDLLFNSDEKIPNDKTIQDYFRFKKYDNEKITNSLKHNYFTGYLNKYDLLIEDYQLVNGVPSKTVREKYRAINLKYENAGRSIGENYRALSNKDKQGDYMGRFYIASDSLINGAVFVTLKAKAKIRETNFYSSINSSQSVGDQVKGYSYALYKDNKLLKSFGDYNYSVHTDFRNVVGQEFEQKNGNSHLIYSDDGITKLIVTTPLMSFIQWVSIFLVLVLYVIVICVVLLIVFSLVLWFSRGLNKYNLFSSIEKSLLKVAPFLDTKNIFLSTKLHLSMFGIIILTFAVTLLITMSYVSNNYYDRQETVLKDKMYRLVKSLESEGNGSIFNKEKEIYALSYQRGVDINVYDTSGDLIIASNNTIFSEGLIGPKLNRNVYEYFNRTSTQELQQKEILGDLSYLSAYYAVYDDDYKISYYINIPYFTQKIELDREISSYVVSLINFYGLVLIISFLVAYFLSRSLAEPLVVIRQYMGEIKLGEENKKIEWKNNDEIGQFVQRYNEMLKQIEWNAKKMASSEREGAWREMAKQVAHEIKNPLTPMKLQVQMLQKSWREKDPRLNEKFERVCALLLERMDAMAEMAIQFSSFSKMPKTEIEAVLLSDVLRDMVDLHSGDDYFTIELNEFEPFIVEVDKEQLSRVFTNLIQNARQAIAEGEKGKLSIHVVENENQLICSFADNGSGVSSENAKNIFEPNFSTKNSGMGMGLAICKKIIESFNGSMSFNSIENKGATFYVVLPLVKD